METHKRSILKAVSWRLFATTVTALVVYLFTREVTLSIGIGLADAGIKMLTYYGHERLWDRISFGRRAKVERII